MKYNFPITSWNDNMTTAQFEILEKIPPNIPITTSMVFVVFDGKVLLSKPKRGWGLPGGHIELGETPVDCAKREVFEETGVNIKNLKLIGGWMVNNLAGSKASEKYPPKAYQLLFTAEVESINKIPTGFESSDREFVALHDISKYHHRYDSFAEILRYALDCTGLS